MSGWLWGTSPFDEAVDKATSELNLAGHEDIALNLEICDQIRSKTVPPKDAMRSIKRRFNHQNPNVQLLALSLLDVCIKNGGDHFLVEVASREFMDNLVSLLKAPAANREVKERILKLIQNCAIAFEGKVALFYVGEVYKTLQREGFIFPPKDTTAANAAMVDTSTAPEWIDSDVCLRCRTAFTFTNRKHHCRNCGQVYDQQCSSKTLPLPHFGIAEPVRVCDTCYFKLKKKNEPTSSVDAKVRRSHSHNVPRPPKPKSLREQADEDLQKAIALSLQESQANQRTGYVPATSASWPGVSEPPVVDPSSRPKAAADDEEDDPELRAAIEASLREMQAPQPSAPAETEAAPSVPSNELHPLESDAIMTFNQTIQEANARGTRDLVRYPGVGELFNRANDLRPKLTTSLDDTVGKEQMLSEMHEKLSEAVKLYDRLLTEQVSNPARRYAQQYAPQYATQPQQQYAPPAPQTSQQYAPPAPQTSQWAAPTQQWQIPPSQVPVTPVPQQQPYQQQGYSYSQPAPSATPTPPRQYTLPEQPPVIPVQEQAPQPRPSYAPPVSATPVPPPPQMQPQEYYQQQQPFQAYAPSSPAQYYQPPPPSVVPPPRQLYASPPPVTPSLPPQQAPAPAVQQYSTMLSNLPSAPTTAPQTYSYAPAFEQKEQKEAMLISFD